jgi:hypothetical protein
MTDSYALFLLGLNCVLHDTAKVLFLLRAWEVSGGWWGEVHSRHLSPPTFD